MRANPGWILVFGATGLLALSVRSADVRADGEVSAEATPVAARQVRTRLEQLEEGLGPYSMQLAEPLAELGIMLLRDGAHAEARRAFRRGMQIERVNLGLYTARQVPLLDLAIESSIAARDWQQVDDDFRYLEWLSYRIHGQQGPELADALGRVIDWHLAAIHLDAEAEKGKHLLRLLELSSRRARLVGEHYGTGHARYIEHLYQLALHHYYIAVAAQRAGPVSETLVTALTSPIVHGRSFLLAQEEIADDCYKKGRRLLESAIGAAGATARDTGEAAGMGLVYLADWELMFNHEGRAGKLYAEAFVALAATGVAIDDLRRFFGTPVLLPEPEFRLALRTTPETADDAAPIRFIPWAREVPGIQFPAANAGFLTAPAERYALARFHVEENGWVENVRIVEVHPDEGGLSRDARNAIWYAQFRPRLEDGRVAVTRDVEARYLPAE